VSGAPLILLTLWGCQRGFEPVRRDDQMSAWMEFVDPGEYPSRLTSAAALGLTVNAALVRGTHDADDLAALCEAAADADVALRLWPLLSEEEGYWANQQNATAFVLWMQELRSWARRDCRHLDGFLVDLEMPLDRTVTLQALIAEGASALEVATFLLEGIDEGRFEAARATYADEVARIQADGLTCQVTALAMLADDLEDGDETLAQALWTPVLGIPWDRVSVQVYRSLFDTYFSAALDDPEQRFGPGLAGSYAATMVEAYGVRASIDLGTTGVVGVGVSEGLSADELQDDIAAALAAGVPVGGIALYSLEGLDDVDAEAAATVPAPRSAEVDPAAAEIRSLFADLDALD
jgi:hypothetical protein